LAVRNPSSDVATVPEVICEALMAMAVVVAEVTRPLASTLTGRLRASP